jgi:L-ascorbate metabolism protein UlaG (beta-lactamase superfamily)
MRSLLALPFLALLGLAAQDPAPKPAAVELELVYLANEGFLVRVGETKLLIDAFVYEPYGEYAHVPEELRAKMHAGEAPFDGIGLALTSHVHGDHFQPEAAAEYLRARPATKFLSSPQVVDALLEPLGDAPAAEHVDARLPEARAVLSANEAGVRIEMVRLPHTGGARTASVQNLGHVLELGGVRVLHVGDAERGDPALDAADLETRAIDVALVPYWWLGDAEGVELARKLTGARHLVAVHVPPAEVAEVKARLAALDPALLLFELPGESRKLSCSR